MRNARKKEIDRGRRSKRERERDPSAKGLTEVVICNGLLGVLENSVRDRR